MGRAFFDVSPELIESILHLRVGMHIYGAGWSFSKNCLRLYVESDKLPELMEAQVPPRIQPRIDYSIDEGYSLDWYEALKVNSANDNQSSA